MAAEEKWYFSKQQLANTPSRKHGFDADRELSSRQQAANLIQDMGQKLQVTQLCINTAIVYMHRFYMFHSFTRFHRNSMAAAALFLAAKVEEQPRKLEHVIKVSQICLHRDQVTIDTRSEAYMEQAQELVVNENILLQTLGFDVAIDHPHTHVVRCCQLVRASKELAQTSYFMASNSLHLTTMCLQYKPTEVACFCIHLACKWSNWEIPQSTEGKAWFWYVDKTVTQELLELLTDEFLVMFEKCPSRLKKKIMSLSSTQNPTILSAFGNDNDKKRNGEGTSTANFVYTEEMKKKHQDFQRHHPDYKKHHGIPPHLRPDAHHNASKSSCMFGPPQRTQPVVHSSNPASASAASGQSRSLPPKPNPAQDPSIKRDHLHHRPRRPDEKHPTRNHEIPPPPYKKPDKVPSLSDFTSSSVSNSNSSNNLRGVGNTSFMLPPSLHQIPQVQPPAPVHDVKPEIVQKLIQQPVPPPKPKTPPIKVERSIFSPEKSTPPMEKLKVPSPILPSLTPGGGTSRKRSISREPDLSIFTKTEDIKPVLETIIKEEKPPDKIVPIPEPILSPIAPLESQDEHKEGKKKKKKQKEHKEKHKDKHKDKHKHKHKNRDGVKADPIVITIPKEKLTLHQPEQGLKIKIPKDRIATSSIPPTPGLKIKISKDKIKESKKRDRSEDKNSGLPTKYHRPNGTTLQVNDLKECSTTENDTFNILTSLPDHKGPKTPPLETLPKPEYHYDQKFQRNNYQANFKNNYRGRGRGRYMRNRGGYNMPRHPNYQNFVPQMNIPPPNFAMQMMHPPPMMPYFASQMLVPNFPPPPPLPEEPPPLPPPPPPDSH